MVGGVVDFDFQSLPPGANALALLLVVAGLFYDLRRLDWRSFLVSASFHRFAGGTVVLSLFWQLSTHLGPGLALHLLGGTAAVLVYGRAKALLMLLIASLLAVPSSPADIWAWPFNYAQLVMGPVWLAHGADLLIRRRLPNHLFVFIFLNAYLVAGVSILGVGLLATLARCAAGAPLAPLLEDYFPYFLMLAFAEAWLTGMAITVMVVYLPGWVASFDDSRYLSNK